MIEYDKENKEIKITEFLSWSGFVKQKLKDLIEFSEFLETHETEADDFINGLTDDDIHNIMDSIMEEIRNVNYDENVQPDYEELTTKGCVAWLEDEHPEIDC